MYSRKSCLAGEITRVLWTLPHCDVIKPRSVSLTCGVTNIEIVALFGFVTLWCLRSLDGLFVCLLISPRLLFCTLSYSVPSRALREVLEIKIITLKRSRPSSATTPNIIQFDIFRFLRTHVRSQDWKNRHPQAPWAKHHTVQSLI